MSNNTESNNSHHNSGWIFLAGLATGAVVGYLINSDKGRQVRDEAATKVVEYSGQARDFAQEKVATVASTVSSIIEKGKAYAHEVSAKLQERIKSGSEDAQGVVEDTETAFQQGANMAKKHLREISAS
ncbi:MAG: YtxH domain-containing protein [Saprospiraceae bacterium]|nr:YtxH domain-containing protein [Saprospiraceae bacterium]